MTLPSVKVFAVALVSLSALGALFFYTYQQHEVAVLPQTAAARVSSAAQAIAELDSDLDGLKDWEESLWGTDPMNPDTDKDGTYDGAEVDAKRDPKQEGSDALPESGIPETPDYFKDNPSLTDATAKQLFADYLALKQSGKLSPVTMQSIVADLTSSIGAQTSARTNLARSDLTIVAESSDNARAYKFALEAIVSRFDEKNNEFIVLAQAANNQFTNLDQLDPFIKSNAEALEELRQIPTPEGLANAHLALLNAFSAYNDALRDLRGLATDPIRSLVGGTQLLTHEQGMQKAFADIAAYLAKWGA